MDKLSIYWEKRQINVNVNIHIVTRASRFPFAHLLVLSFMLLFMLLFWRSLFMIKIGKKGLKSDLKTQKVSQIFEPYLWFFFGGQ